MLKRLMLSLAVIAPTFVGGVVATTSAAEAQQYRGHPPRHRCWTERQRVRVWGPHGRPHFVWRTVRVCR